MGERVQPTLRRALFEVRWQFERSLPQLFQPRKEFPSFTCSEAGKTSDRQDLPDGRREARLWIANDSPPRQQEFQQCLGERRLRWSNAQLLQERPRCPMTTQDGGGGVAFATPMLA